MATKKKPAAKKPAAKKAVAKKPAEKKVAKKEAKDKKPAAKNVAKKAAVAKKPAAKKVAKKAGVKRKPSAAFMKPMNISPVLAAVIGAAAMPRTEVINKIWHYIKKHKLQDSANRRMINGDDKLGAVFGAKKQVSMFEMTKLVNNHIK